MQTAYAHQDETLDDVLYRITGNTAPIAQVMADNPHTLRSPRLAEGTPVQIPRATPTKPAPTVKLWE